MNEPENLKFTNIKQLFQGTENIKIPPYQRAYSWEEKHCNYFLEDLLEQKGKRYYLGQFLFEKEENIFYIIDGQQRLTTTVLFLSAIAKIQKQRGENADKILEVYLTDDFTTIDNDQIIFRKITQKHHVSLIDDTETISQRRLIKAFTYFESELIKLSSENLTEVQNTLENAVISTFFISNKAEATQVFEYQNNRGKELSRFEIIKAYLMHQVYLQGENSKQTNADILSIQTNISHIYRDLEAVESYFTENELLDNYCSIFYGFNASAESIKERLKKETDKPKWIKLFFENFAEISSSAKTIINQKSVKTEISNLFLIGNEANWKIVLLTIFYKCETENTKFRPITKLLEIL